jgi:hypothetical protein
MVVPERLVADLFPPLRTAVDVLTGPVPVAVDIWASLGCHQFA